MAQQNINVGTNPNDGTGDSLRNGFIKTNDNFTELYSDKENTANKSATTTLGTSDVLFPTQKAVKTYVDNGLSTKQNTLVSGTNIKTINGNSILGSGDLTITGGISGSGTDNYIPRFNGTTALENSIIFDDGTNVGIGGSASFDFGGFANIPAVKILKVGDEPTLRFYRPSGGTPNARIFQIQNTIGDLTFGYALANKYSESTFSEAMRITSIGNVGIGTSSPITKLDLGSSTGQKLSIYSSGNDRAGFGIETSTLRYYTPTNTIHSFGHLSTSDGVTFSERMRIDSDGKVGIGTSSPSETLHVNGNLKIADGSTIKLHITDTILNGIIEYNGFMIDNTTTQFGIDVGTGAMIGVKASTDAVFTNSASEYFGLAGGSDSKLVASNALMQSSPADGTTITNWIKVEDENGSKFYLPLYQ